MATLFVVGTPIGNLEDITLRALRVLKEVDLILCEDTRVTKRLLSKYEIDTPTMSYHAQSKLAKVDKILSLLEEGKNLALVSDAGTPCISDPGVLLVSQVREKFGLAAVHSAQAGDAVAVVPIPGPSALIT
ncbi:MAG: SAM-dependent methyltransferase, partial [Patescibacteria group bacterium]